MVVPSGSVRAKWPAMESSLAGPGSLYVVPRIEASGIDANLDRSYLNRNLFMLKSNPLKSSLMKSILNDRSGYAAIAALCLLAAMLALPSAASAQFTLQAAPLSPDAVDPGGTSSSNISVGATNGFNAPVDLSCQVTSTTGTVVDAPMCTVSPATVTPPASASATITTMGGTSPVSYSFTVTGVAPSTAQTTTTLAQSLTVLPVTPQFTITVEKAVSPTSVQAGSGAEATIQINPINGYPPTGTAQVTLSCSSILPLVAFPPYCSFSPNPLPVNSGQVATSTLTINTFGTQITKAAQPRTFYALWLPLPMLALVGVGAAVGGKRSRKAWGLLALFIMSGALFLMPACGNTKPNTSAPNGITPDNTYIFTVTGVDAAGNIASNTGSTTSTNPSVTLTVTTQTTN
jgi:hypothetical protein